MALVDLESSPDRQHTLTPLRNKRVNAISRTSHPFRSSTFKFAIFCANLNCLPNKVADGALLACEVPLYCSACFQLRDLDAAKSRGGLHGYAVDLGLPSRFDMPDRTERGINAPGGLGG